MLHPPGEVHSLGSGRQLNEWANCTAAPGCFGDQWLISLWMSLRIPTQKKKFFIIPAIPASLCNVSQSRGFDWSMLAIQRLWIRPDSVNMLLPNIGRGQCMNTQSQKWSLLHREFGHYVIIFQTLCGQWPGEEAVLSTATTNSAQKATNWLMCAYWNSYSLQHCKCTVKRYMGMAAHARETVPHHKTLEQIYSAQKSSQLAGRNGTWHTESAEVTFWQGTLPNFEVRLASKSVHIVELSFASLKPHSSTLDLTSDAYSDIQHQIAIDRRVKSYRNTQNPA